MRSSPTSTVLINIGRGIANDAALLELSKNTFGRGVQVSVGGYAQKLADDKDAPFVWVFSDEDDTQMQGEEEIGFTAKVVVGICPNKDVPSVDTMFAAADTLAASANDFADTADTILECIDPSMEIYTPVATKLEALRAGTDAVSTYIAASRTATANGDYVEMIACMQQARASVATAESKFAEIKDIVEDVPEADEAVEETEEKKTVMDEKNTALATEITAVVEAFAKFEDDPFISEVERARDEEHNGLTIYGAIRTVDRFKNRLIQILSNGNFGMPFKSVKFKNQSVAHYPLDWSELTVTFERQETLSL